MSTTLRNSRTASHLTPVRGPRSDSARLDWLETWGLEVASLPRTAGWGTWRLVSHATEAVERPGLRAAIDAAMDEMESQDVR